jgi:hypothetical protein
MLSFSTSEDALLLEAVWEANKIVPPSSVVPRELKVCEKLFEKHNKPVIHIKNILVPFVVPASIEPSG